MAINQSFVGKAYPKAPVYEVGREKIREFATAIGDFNPAYHNVDAARELGHDDLIAPPTFPFVLTIKSLALAMFDPDLGLDYGRVVHGEQHFDYVRPIQAGDRLTVSTVIDDIHASGSNEFLTAKSEVRTSDGELVVTTREVIVSRGTAGAQP
ncbi:MAG: MaoC family dehydratase N-terminal domain-containing protein [Candidatus Nanopelagicales bacterium]|nr:MaoC family dehydratase N-terminal domain-containing protein [Candidatus Nanopelagicales bacterium]MDZ4248701.1 MaoC family dehydratase N-terminal domain-containing protein [Candidatus Nanopelagicales bacterium]